MNFTENILRDDDPDFDFGDAPELAINPRFYGNQSVDNLIDLKLWVHNLLNVPLLFLCSAHLVITKKGSEYEDMGLERLLILYLMKCWWY